MAATEGRPWRPSPGHASAGTATRYSSSTSILGKLARPSSPAAVLSHAAVERLSGPLEPCAGAGGARRLGSASMSASAGALPELSRTWQAGGGESQPGSPQSAASRRGKPQAGKPQRRFSRAARAFDQKLSLNFEEIDGRTESPKMFTSASSKRLGSPDRQDVGLSFASRRENYRKEQYEVQFERARDAGSPGGSASTSDLLAATTTAEELGVMKPEAFLADISSVEKQFPELERSIRLEHMGEGGAAERLRAEREAERKRREEAMRRARKKEQQARDPKKKVALRLHNKREFEMEKVKNDTNIPIKMTDFGGGYKVHEEIPLVDVRGLRRKCQFMEDGMKVRGMLEDMARKERQQRASAFAASLGPSTSPSGYSTASLNASFSPSEVFEMKRKYYKELAATRFAEVQLQKIGAMRNTLTYQLPYTFEVAHPHIPEVVSDDGQPEQLKIHMPVPNVPPQRGKDERKVAMMLASHFSGGDLDDVAGSLTFPTLQRSNLAAMFASGPLADPKAKALPKKPRTPKQEVPQEVDTEEVVRSAAQKRWTAARALVQWILVYHQVQRKSRAADIVTSLIQQLGEWSRIKKAIKEFMRNLRKLQKVCRAFAQTKKKRCAIIDKDWQRVEDQSLQVYFSVAGFAAAQSRATDPTQITSPKIVPLSPGGKKKKKQTSFDPPKSDALTTMEANSLNDEFSFDWRNYRIPLAERKRAISRYYMQQLRNTVQRQGSFMATIRVALAAERDLTNFLAIFGAEAAAKEIAGASQTSSLALAEEKSNFWQLPEEQVLQLIAGAAQNMIGVEPFKFHPANLDNAEASGKTRRSRQEVSLGRMAHKSDKGGRSQSAGEGAEGEKNRQQKKLGKVDVEKVFDQFTPRLREICEKQTTEYRSANAVLTDPSGQGPGEGDGGEAGSRDDDIFVLGLAHANQLPVAGGG